MNSKLSKENNVEYYIDLNTFLSLAKIYEFEFFLHTTLVPSVSEAKHNSRLDLSNLLMV